MLRTVRTTERFIRLFVYVIGLVILGFAGNYFIVSGHIGFSKGLISQAFGFIFLVALIGMTIGILFSEKNSKE